MLDVRLHALGACLATWKMIPKDDKEACSCCMVDCIRSVTACVPADILSNIDGPLLKGRCVVLGCQAACIRYMQAYLLGIRSSTE